MTAAEVTRLIAELRKVFDIVRLVDVATTTVCATEASKTVTHGEDQCFAVWDKPGRCENCVSARAFAQKTRLTKFEFIGSDIFYVVSKYVEVDDKPYVLEIVSNVTDHVLLGTLGKERLIQSVEHHNNKLYRDPLTGAYNREYYEEHLASFQQASALAMIDVDNFKQINDTFGHLAGDKALQVVVETLQKNMRGVDAVIRYGGDEFLLVFRSMEREAFRAKLEQLRELVSQAKVEGYPDLRITVSIGGNCTGDAGMNRIRMADESLYRAKETRNTVCFYCD